MSSNKFLSQMKRKIKVSVSGWFHNQEDPGDLRDKKITFFRSQYFGDREDSTIIPNTMPIYLCAKRMDNGSWQDLGFGVSQVKYVYET